MTNYFIHPLSDVSSKNIGKSSRIWQFVVIMEGAKIGEDCNICANCLIEEDVAIGNRVTVKSGVQLWNGIRIEDDVFIGPNVSFSNDRFPRSRKKPDSFAQTLIRSGASIGAGAVVLPGLEIGRNAMVGAGAVVTRSVPENAIVIGNPAKIIGYAGAQRLDKAHAKAMMDAVGKAKTDVSGVTFHRLPKMVDIRGSLTVGEFLTGIPFLPKRYFIVFGVPSVETRGEHAHRLCHQFLVCVHGSCAVVADDGTRRQEFLLNRPDIGLHLEPLTWGIQYKYSADAVLLVFASHYYDNADYIRDYSEFRNLVTTQQ